MQTTFLLALALVIRNIPSVDGVAEFTPQPGQRIIDAYSAVFEPVWRHAVQTTIVDRVAAARTGRVTGLGPDERVVFALSDERVSFDATQPLSGEPTAFPYSPEFVRAYEKRTGRNYVRDIMVVAAPTLGSQDKRAMTVADLYETLFAGQSDDSAAFRSFGSGEAGSVLVVTSRSRIWSWLDRCRGDDGSDYAKALAAKGYRVDLADRNVWTRMSVGTDGFVRVDGRRYGTIVLRHLSWLDAADCRRVLGVRPLGTKVYATDAPLVHGAEITWSDPDI